MKPRLPPAPLTPEDFAIWDRFMDPPPPREGISAVDYVMADRHDADLMFGATNYRAHFPTWNPHTLQNDLLIMGPSLEWVACGGARQR